MSYVNGKPKCDMKKDCAHPVSHIGEKGFIYCADHASQRNYERCRKMRPWELRWIRAGKSLPSYTPGPEPKPAPTTEG